MLSILLKTFSIALSYPTSSLFDAMKNGDIVHVLRDETKSLSNNEKLSSLIVEIDNGIQSIVDSGLQSLESDYISLFEANHEYAPVHMYANLYNSNKEDCIGVMQRLHSLYQQFGLSIKQGGEGDHPDHLVIQLEFMAYLLQRLNDADVNDLEQRDTLQNCIQEFSQELLWIPNFLTALEQHPSHPFYTSLVRLLNELVSNPSISLGLSD